MSFIGYTSEIIAQQKVRNGWANEVNGNMNFVREHVQVRQKNNGSSSGSATSASTEYK